MVINKNVKIIDGAIEIWDQNCSKANTIFHILWRCRVFLVKLVTGPSFKLISLLVLQLWQFPFIRGLARNLQIRSYLIWVLSNIWKLGPVRDIKFGVNVSNKKLLNAVNARHTAFTISELLKLGFHYGLTWDNMR